MSSHTQRFDCRPSKYVGRVGALAVALGVGGAVLGFAGVAMADPGPSEGGARSASDESRTGDTGRATAARAADRRTAAAGQTSAPATAAGTEGSNDRVVGPGQRPLGPRASEDRSSTSAVFTPPSLGGSTSVKIAVGNRVLPALPRVPVDVGPDIADGIVSQAPTAQPIAVTVTREVSPAAATAPVATAPAPGTVLAASPLPLFGGTDRGLPLLAPLAWATLAAARRGDPAAEPAEALPADTVGTEDLDAGLGAQINTTGLSSTSGAVGTLLTITGTNLGTTSAVKFGCSASACDWGIDGEIVGTPSKTTVQVIVPQGAPTGNVQVIATYLGAPSNAISKQVFTVTGVLPTITDFTPTTGGLGSTVTITGENFAGATFVNFGAGSATVIAVNETGTEITVAVPDNATDGRIVVGLPTGGAVSTTNFTIPLAPLPALSACTGSGVYCATVAAARVLAINALSAAVGAALPSSGPVGKCTSNGCPTVSGQSTPSVANTIGEYAFNLVYSLSGKDSSAADIGQTVVNLVTQPNVLTFISDTVAGSPALAALPTAVASTIGTAVASFVQNTFGNATVATAFAPFLRALNIPTAANLDFIANLQTDPMKALLDRFTPAQQAIGQAALQQSFFGNAAVQQIFGQAFSESIDALVGSTELSSYLGQVAASALVGQPVDPTNPLAVAIGGAIGTLFSGIGGIVATDAGTALANLLAQPALDGQPAVASTLAQVVVNGVVTALGGTVTPVAVLPALAPGAGVVVTQFVDSLLTNPDVDSALGTFLTQLTTGVLGDPVGQQVVSGVVSNAVSGLLGGGPLAHAVAQQAGAAVASLVSNPAVSGAVAQLVNSLFGGVLGADGVVTALAETAGGLVSAVFGGEPVSTALNTALTALAANPDVDAAVGPAVTTAVAQFLGNTDLRSTVDAAVTALVTGLIGDPTVQSALRSDVASAVSALLGGGSLGQTVGDKVGTAVLSVITNPAVSGALADLVDTVFSDFISAPGVITALSDAAGQLATAAFEGTFDSVLPAVEAALRANPDIDGAVQASVAAAVAQFLGDTDVWSAVDTGISSLVGDLIADTTVQQALQDRVASEVNSFLGFGPISVVGEYVGAAVVGLLTSPAISGALVDLVDTLLTDFSSSAGVVDALAGAAGDVALAVFTGEPLEAALAAAGKALQTNPAVDAAVQASVGAAVTAVLGNADVWSAVDTGISSLATQLITDPVVRQVLNDRIADEVSTLLGGGDLGSVVGGQVAATVVDLLANPAFGGALLELVDTVFSDLFVPNLIGNPVPAAFGEAAGDLALAALTLTGADFDAARAAIVQGLRNNPAVDAGVQTAVVDAVAQFLNDTAAWTAVDAASASLLGELLGDSEVQQALGDRVANVVNSQLGLGPMAVVGEQVGQFVVGLLINPAVSGALVDVVDNLFTGFFGVTGVVDALSGAAGDVALAVLTGDSLTAAVQAALSALEVNPAIQAGVQITVADALGVINAQVLGNATFQQDLGTDVTNLINELTADQVVQNLVTERFGAAIGGLVANTAVMEEFSSAVGSAVTQLLGYSGVSTALTNAAARFIDAVLAGTDAATAAQEALASLRSDPTVADAANAVIPPIVNSLLDTANVRQALGVAAQEATIAQLEQSWLNIPFLNRVIGEIAKGTVQDFLTRTAGQSLIDTVAVDLVLGKPVNVADEILRRPDLQIALGFSIGAGVGSLFGENIVGDIIGWVAGFPATIVVGGAAAVIDLYRWIVDGWMLVVNAISGQARPSEALPAQSRSQPNAA